ncbi:hypothetical protein I316_04447 [Kwoniella heveanensis BCC8398]|uniref:Uncharacterized protein n=1 Tax=Kwoniella heveanensis BCC8398 TaxID=1296120 RepID=A0A1B9GSA5_9TREE|nr:hypothetical protein I316_04447 [Kwoniella heveanensis BCC8398]
MEKMLPVGTARCTDAIMRDVCAKQVSSMAIPSEEISCGSWIAYSTERLNGGGGTKVTLSRCSNARIGAGAEDGDFVLTKTFEDGDITDPDVISYWNQNQPQKQRDLMPRDADALTAARNQE